MLDTGHPGKHSGITPGCIFPCFLPEIYPWYILCTCVHPCDIITAQMMPPNGRAHPQVYCFQKWSKSDWRFQRYWHFYVTPLLKIISYSDHYQHLTTQHLRHGFRSNATTTYHPVCPGHCRCYCQCTDSKDSINKPAHLWLELPRCIPLLLHILPYLGELAPPQPYTAWQQGPPQVCFCSPRHQIPRDACTMDANWQQRGTEGNQGQSFCLPRLYPAGNDTRCQSPCASWRIGRYCG